MKLNLENIATPALTPTPIIAQKTNLQTRLAPLQELRQGIEATIIQTFIPISWVAQARDRGCKWNRKKPNLDEQENPVYD